MRSVLLLITAFAAVGASAGAASAQDAATATRGSLAITPHGGYLLSQRFIDGPLGTSLNVSGAPMYGVQLSLPITSSLALMGGVAQANGDLKAGFPILGGISLGETRTTVFDGALELRLNRSASGMIPILQLGGGAIRREVTVAGVSASSTDFQLSGGIGADIPLASNIALRVLAKDHFGKADFGGIGDLRARTDDVHAVALTGGIRISF